MSFDGMGGMGSLFGQFIDIDANRARDTSMFFANRRNSAQEYKRQKKLMGQQWGYQMKALEESPSRYMEGLKKAGLNPILAANPQVASGQTGASAPKTSPVNSNASTEFAALMMEAPVKEASAKLLSEQANTEKAKQAQMGADTKIKKQTATRREPITTFIEESPLTTSAKKTGEIINEVAKDPNYIIDNFWDKNIPNRVKKALKTLLKQMKGEK